MPQHSASPDRHHDMDGANIPAADDELMMALVGVFALIGTFIVAVAIKAAL